MESQRGSRVRGSSARPPDPARGARDSCGNRAGHLVAGSVRGTRRAPGPCACRQDVETRVGEVQVPPPEARGSRPLAARKGSQSSVGRCGAGRAQLPPPAPRPGTRGAAGPSLPPTTPGAHTKTRDSRHESSRRQRPLAGVSSGPCARLPPFVGLINQGLTCYLNALLQCLFVTPEFRDRVQEPPRSSRLQQALEQIFRGLEERRGPVQTRALTACLGLGYGQQDVGEVFLLLLDRLDRDDVQEVFQSEVEKVIRCAVCGSEDHIPPGGRTLLLPLASHAQLCGLDRDGQAPREPPREPAGYAQDTGALSFSQIQNFDDEDNLFFCECCNQKTPSSEEKRFLRLPQILVLQASELTFENGKFHKTQGSINVSQVLELQSTPQAPAASHPSGSSGARLSAAPERKRYQLYAVCSHVGDYSGGHYTALVQPPGEEQWYHFNDQWVDCVGPFPQQDTHRSGVPYLLLYRCQDSGDSPKVNPRAAPCWAGASRGPPAMLRQGQGQLEPGPASTAPAPAQVGTWV